MNITLDEWLKIADAHAAAYKALKNLESVLCEAWLSHLDKPNVRTPESDLCRAMLDITGEAIGDLARYNPQPHDEWTGGDSSLDKNTAIREPLCVQSLGGGPLGYLAHGMSLLTYRKRKAEEATSTPAIAPSP